MSDAALFLSGIGLTILASLSIVTYLKPHLKTVLIDLCGSIERANFWTAFSNVAISLVPLIFAMHYRPGTEERTAIILELGRQLEWALVGLVASVVMLGIVLSRFIPKARPQMEIKQGTKAAA